MIEPRSARRSSSTRTTLESDYHRRNPQRRIRAEMHIRMRRVQRFAGTAVRAQGSRPRHRHGGAGLLHECHPGHLPEHRVQRPGLQHRLWCRSCLRIGHVKRVPCRGKEDERYRVRRRRRHARYRHPGNVGRIRAGHRFPVYLLR